ncbi:MAG TPA: M20/M25/M40 family metallo-hydrolase [Gaiellaceae bacterium]|jgi:acetylornithine deacetylase
MPRSAEHAGGIAAHIEHEVRRRSDEFVDALVALLGHASVNPAYDGGAGEAAAQEELAKILAGFGLETQLREPQPADFVRFEGAEAVATTSFAGRPNLTARLGEGAGRTLLLNSHADVVPAGEGWKADAFRPRVRGGTILARGAADAKGSLVAMACALCVVASLELELAGSVLFQSVVDEEAGGGGTLAEIGGGLTVDAAVVGEPTGLALCPATRGSRRFQVEVEGRSAHPGEAFLGVNAGEKAMVLVAAIRDLAAALDRERPHPLWSDLPEQHVFNLNYLETGRLGFGAVPDRCSFEMAAGGTAAETIEELQSEVEIAIATASGKDDWLAAHPPELTWGPLVLHASATPADHPFVESCASAYTSALGKAPRIAALSAVTDMRLLVRHASIPTLNFGPGHMRDAHGPEESLELEDFLAAIRVLAGVVVDWCGT